MKRIRLTGRRLALLAALLLALAIAWLLRPEAVAVETAVATEGPLRVLVEEDGETRVRNRYLVSAPITGRMERLQCAPGDVVTAGQVLARIYPLPLDSRARAEAAGRVEASQATQAAAEARVRQAEASWGEARRHLDRLERLADEGFLTEERMDQARVAEQTSALELEAARGAAEAAGHGTRTALAALLSAGGGAEAAPTLVRAPAAGRVLRLYEECERAVAAGAPIAEVGDPERLEVVVEVLTQDAGRIRPGAPMLVVPGPDAVGATAVVQRVEPSAFTRVSPLGVEEQRVAVVGSFPGGPPLLGDRFRVEVAIVVREEGRVLRVPVSALFREGSAWAVFVVEDGRARMRVVGIGDRGEQGAEVISGLAAGDEVILYPGEDVAEGARVRTLPGSAAGLRPTDPAGGPG